MEDDLAAKRGNRKRLWIVLSAWTLSSTMGRLLHRSSLDRYKLDARKFQRRNISEVKPVLLSGRGWCQRLANIFSAISVGEICEDNGRGAGPYLTGSDGVAAGRTRAVRTRKNMARCCFTAKLAKRNGP